MFLDENTKDSVKTEICNLIHEVGKEFSIQYYTYTACPYGVDKSYLDGKNPHCSTCNGSGVIKSFKPKKANGLLNSFLNNKGFKDNINTPINVVPFGYVRATFWLDDVLVNLNSAEAGTYFDRCDYITVNSKKYTVADTNRTGFDKPFFVQVILSEIR